MVTAVMPRSRWPRQRVFRLGFLLGRGFRAPDIAVDPLIGSTEDDVREMVGQMGATFADLPRGNLMIDLGPLIRAFADHAKRRRQTVEQLARDALAALARDGSLLDNVLDDGR